jgi:glycerate kinase
VRALVAPQEFKGSLTAVEAVAAIARGIREARPSWEVDELPLSDGGPGFLDALHAAIGGRRMEVATRDALGRARTGSWLLDSDGTAFVEAAQANALVYLSPAERAPLTAGSFGVGEILRAALGTSPAHVVVGVGGSASSDGGAGMAQALGARLLDRRDLEIGSGGGVLTDLDRIEWSRPVLPPIDVATDVTNPLLGPDGAAAVFGPQKGATPGDVAKLELAFARFAEVVERDLGIDVRTLPGGGAAGGLAAGLVALLGARIVSGFDVVAGACRFAERLAAADVVVTGEGSFDVQSGRGKTTGRVIAAAEAAGKRWIVFAGRAEGRAANVYELSTEVRPGEDSVRDAAAVLERLAARVFAGGGPHHPAPAPTS